MILFGPIHCLRHRIVVSAWSLALVRAARPRYLAHLCQQCFPKLSFPVFPSFQLSVAAVPRPSVQASTLSTSSWLLLRHLVSSYAWRSSLCVLVLHPRISFGPSIFPSRTVLSSLPAPALSRVCVSSRPLLMCLWSVLGSLSFSLFSVQSIVAPATDSLQPIVPALLPLLRLSRFSLLLVAGHLSPHTFSPCSCGFLPLVSVRYPPRPPPLPLCSRFPRSASFSRSDFFPSYPCLIVTDRLSGDPHARAIYPCPASATALAPMPLLWPTTPQGRALPSLIQALRLPLLVSAPCVSSWHCRAPHHRSLQVLAHPFACQLHAPSRVPP